MVSCTKGGSQKEGQGKEDGRLGAVHAKAACTATTQPGIATCMHGCVWCVRCDGDGQRGVQRLCQTSTIGCAGCVEVKGRPVVVRHDDKVVIWGAKVSKVNVSKVSGFRELLDGRHLGCPSGGKECFQGYLHQHNKWWLSVGPLREAVSCAPSIRALPNHLKDTVPLAPFRNPSS